MGGTHFCRIKKKSSADAAKPGTCSFAAATSTALPSLKGWNGWIGFFGVLQQGAMKWF